MEYYIYLLQIFGGGNPKIHEVIKAYGNARNAYEHISGGDLSRIPSNRHENVRRASLERSKVITDYCAENNISIITLDNADYPEELKNIYNPPVLLFASGDTGCLKDRLAVSVVGPRNPSAGAIRLAENICYNLARCDIVLVSGFALGVDRIAHNNSIRHKKPTVAVLACGITVDYPKNSFGLREEITDNGGLVISELLPDTPCNPDYFRFRNRIISGLSKGTVVVGGYNGSGSLITANHAFEQDREVFFTIPEDTLDNNNSKIIRFLRDGAHPVYDFYDVINEFYPTYRNRIDDTYLDKEQLTSFVIHEDTEKPSPADMPETVEKSEKATDNKSLSKAKEPLPKAKASEAPRFKITSITDKEKEIDYFKVTPESVLKKRKRATKPALQGKTVTENKNIKTGSVSEPVQEPNRAEMKAAEISQEQNVQINEVSDMTPKAAEILGMIAKSDGVTLDTLLSACDISFGELSEILADLEIGGTVSCGAGGIYRAEKAK